MTQGEPSRDVVAAIAPASSLAATGGRAGLLSLFSAFLRVGSTSFGMAVLQGIRSAPVGRGWLSQEEVDEGFGLVQLYPGAIGVDLTAYIGYHCRGVIGALVATAGLLAPSFVLMLGLSWIYATYGAVPGVQSLVTGLSAVVVAVVASMVIDLALLYARGRLVSLIALAAFAVSVAGVNVFIAVVGGLIIGGLALRPQDEPTAPPAGPAAWLSRRRLAIAAVPALVVIAGAIAAAILGGPLAAVTLSMTKIGTVAFGNGAAILPILQQEVVGSQHWLDAGQFGIAIALGQVTPGPFLIAATFIGYQVAGPAGAFLATIAIFGPSIAMTTIAAEIYPILRRVPAIKGSLRGVLAVFVGMIAAVVLSLGRPVFNDPAAVILAASAFVFVRVFRWNLFAVFALGVAAWAIFLVVRGLA